MGASTTSSVSAPPGSDGLLLIWQQWLAAVTAPGAAGRLQREPASLPPALARADRAAFESVGVRYDPSLPRMGHKFVGTGDLYIAHAPGDEHGRAHGPASHAALGLKLDSSDETFWWVDGQPLSLGPAAPGSACFDSCARWVDACTLAVTVGRLDHPLDDPRTHTLLGQIFGLLLHDAESGRSLLVLPDDSERWTDPVAERRGVQLAIHAAREAATGDAARLIRFP